ncbi:MAG TPA: (Fe-S)-binding protein [Thermoanaerobaculaceae bacterium]|nr:(Fe-S)-binding protein [Thermoanaerobaculaceae bacterium]HRS17379.1 (Fe-S)-binding protein [Thermoanaerobaculaceae bacterium]
MEHHATAGSLLGVPGTAWFYVLAAVAVAGVVYSLQRKIRLLAAGRGGVALADWPARVCGLFVWAIGQKRMFAEPVPGIMHALIFWGFLVFVVRSLSLVIEGLAKGWELPLLRTPLGSAYLLTKDVFIVLVLVGVAIAAWRRLVTRPERLEYSADAWVILGLIALLMVTDALADGARIAGGAPGPWQWTPVSRAVGSLLGGGSLHAVYVWSWWVHLGALFLFANYLPYSKHFHVYTSLPNVLLRPLDPPGKLEKMDLENIGEGSTLGAQRVTDLTWKQLLDLYTCTECGRCTTVCPTTITHKPLVPRDLTIDLRDHLNAACGEILGAARSGPGTPARELAGDVIDSETVWACTTCRWCEQACPLFISYVDKIVEMRRHLVLEKATFPEEAEIAFRGMEVNGNPWQLPAEQRADWAKGLGVPLAAEGASFEYLFWVGCAGAYDEAGQQASRALARLLAAAGVSFAILGPEETCTGDAARRLGNEYLFQTLAAANVETLNRYDVKKIVTNCPHCLNTLQHEYPDFGGRFEVVHGTQLVAQLLAEGRLALTGEVRQVLTYHDPCYLGRSNGEYEAPRRILAAIPGLVVKEAELSREKAMCCGAGGGRMWLEEKLGERINQTRVRQLQASGASDVAVACPFCAVMIGNGQQELGFEQARTVDVLVLAARALGETARS